MESVATIGDARLQQKTYCYSENAHFEVVGTNEVYRFSLGNVLRLSDRCLHIAAIFYLLISTGCSESSVPEDTVLTQDNKSGISVSGAEESRINPV